MKSRRLILLMLLCVLLAIPAAAKSSAEIRTELDDLKAQAQELQDQNAALEADLKANAAETQSTVQQKSAIDQQIHMTEAELENANQQLQQYSLLIAETQSELEDAEAELAEMNETYKTRLRAMEESGTVSYWSILFQASSFSDLLDRIDMIREIARADQEVLAQLEEQSLAVQAARDALRQDLADQQAAKDELAQLEQTLRDQRAQADQLLLQLAEDEANLTEDYLAGLDAQAAVSEEIRAAQLEYEAALSAEAAARLAQANANNVAGGGASSGTSVTPNTSGFISPLPAGAFVTDAYGWRIHPIKKVESFHTGVDLAANQGTAIYATAAGVVAAASYSDAYGYYVSLSHGNGYGSFYGHMTNYIVAAGDSVSQGQVIGYVGSTGIYSTGPHLHFEISVNGNTVNPMEYITLS